MQLLRSAALLALLSLTSSPVLLADNATEEAALAPRVVKIFTTNLALISELQATLDVWSVDPREGTVLALVSAEAERSLISSGLRLEIDTERTEEFLTPRPTANPEGTGIPGFPCYRTVEETHSSLNQLAIDNPTLAQWVDYGDSWEKTNGPGSGYDMQVLVLSNSQTTGPKFPFILMAAMHARELSTAETATLFAEELVNGYGTDPDATWLLDYGEIHIIAQQNPDGRKQAESGASWRKNVNNNHCGNTSSRGIDLNRNSSFFWGGTGSSGNTCSQVYRGPTAASEPETLAIEAYLGQVFDDQRGTTGPAPDTTTGLFISLHSFGGFVLYPWEGQATVAPNGPQLAALAQKFGFLTGYLACQDGLPPAGGTTPDQAYGEYGVAAYTFELGTSFFQSCSSFSSTVLPNALPALRYAAKAARRPYQEPAGPDVLSAMVSAASIAAGDPVTLTATADDTRTATNGSCSPTANQNIAEARYTIGLPPWEASTSFPMAASDGSFDSLSEGVTAQLDTASLSTGKHLIYLYGIDAAGNQGVPTAIFLEVSGGADDIFVDGFESGDTNAWSSEVR